THLGVDQGTAADAASGWGGDRLRVAQAGEGGWALAWTIAFDTPADATEFGEAHAEITELEAAAELVTVSATEFLVLHASSQSLLEKLAAAAEA
ncbi:MAG: hypothetical protein ACRDHD_13120, partial [Candidatus Limnocylindria bacterium]